MGKKYFDTKKGTLESSILGVWKTAAEENAVKMDGRTKGYKTHREKLEAARLRREKKNLNKEEVQLDEATGKEIAAKMMKDRSMKAFASKVAKMKTVSRDDLEKMLPDYVAGAAITKLFEEVELDEGTKAEYEKFFNKAMKKFKIDSPSDLKSDEDKKKFYDYVDKNYKGEKSEELLNSVDGHENWVNEKKLALAKEFKVQSMRDALAKVWGSDENSIDEGKMKNAMIKAKDMIDEGASDSDIVKATKLSPKVVKDIRKSHSDRPGEYDEDKKRTVTGEKIAAIEIDPKIKDKAS